MDYGKAIRICRTASDLTQIQLADRLSIGPSQVSLIESGKRQPSVKVLAQVSEALEVPPHLLTLLASEPGDIDDQENKEAVGDLARSLLRLLVSAGRHPTLPLIRE